jgi:hypothetical protein
MGAARVPHPGNVGPTRHPGWRPPRPWSVSISSQQCASPTVVRSSTGLGPKASAMFRLAVSVPLPPGTGHHARATGTSFVSPLARRLARETLAGTLTCPLQPSTMGRLYRHSTMAKKTLDTEAGAPRARTAKAGSVRRGFRHISHARPHFVWRADRSSWLFPA